MEVNKEELRRLAGTAKIKSSGDWKVFTPDDYQAPDQLPGLGVEDCEGKAIVWYAELPESGIQYDEHASFIAAASPAAILSLLDENKSLLDQVAALQSDANSWQSGYDKGREMVGKHRAGEERNQLRAENERLRKDAERYQFLRDVANPAALGWLHFKAKRNEWDGYIDNVIGRVEGA